MGFRLNTDLPDPEKLPQATKDRFRELGYLVYKPVGGFSWTSEGRRLLTAFLEFQAAFGVGRPVEVIGP